MQDQQRNYINGSNKFIMGVKFLDKIIYSSANALAQAIRIKEISSEEVVEAHLQRIEEVNPKLNAIVQLQANEVREQARKADAALARGDIKGPLHGVPFTIKDNAETKGIVSVHLEVAVEEKQPLLLRADLR